MGWLFIIFSLSGLVATFEKKVRFFNIIFFDLKKEPSERNKNANIFLLNFKPKIRAIKKQTYTKIDCKK